MFSFISIYKYFILLSKVFYLYLFEYIKKLIKLRYIIYIMYMNIYNANNMI